MIVFILIAIGVLMLIMSFIKKITKSQMKVGGVAPGVSQRVLGGHNG